MLGVPGAREGCDWLYIFVVVGRELGGIGKLLLGFEVDSIVLFDKMV